MKLLTFHGSGLLEVPGHFTIEAGQSHELSDELAEQIVAANPDLPITITDAAERGASRRKSQPEAQKGEGQPTAPDKNQEE